MRVYSVFRSINGEICHAHQGSICTFIRLAGCNLTCKWCDSKKAQDPFSGEEMPIRKIANTVEGLNCKTVTITGGEPLYQLRSLRSLVEKLLTIPSTTISIETNGSFPIPRWSDSLHQICWVADYKLPSSGMERFMNIKNYRSLTHKDFIKFVVDDELDYNQAKYIMHEIVAYGCGRATFALSPTSNMNPKKLIEWMLRDNGRGVSGKILSLQIHKILGLMEDSPE